MPDLASAFDRLHGPGPTIHGRDRNLTGRWLVQRAGQVIESMTAAGVAAIPIGQQWITATNNGLICSWPSRDLALQTQGVPIGQILPVTVTADMVGQRVVILADPSGRPLPGAAT